MSLSRTHLHRKIKAATNLSTSLFIRKVRLEKARQLLEETDHNISEIAYLTGNKSLQNFSKYFIKQFGISPSAYRKQFKTGNLKQEGAHTLHTKWPDRDQWRKIKFGGLVLALVFLLGFMGKKYLFSPKGNSNDLALKTTSIAVIPFQNESKVADDFLSEGIVEDILVKLSQLENIKALSKVSTEQFKGAPKNIQQIGTRLGVSHILVGKIREEVDRVRIKVELIRVDDNQLIWSERYNQSKQKLVNIQADVAENIAKALNQTLQPELKQKLERLSTNNQEAYTALLRGRHLMRSRTQEDLLKSRDQFLIALDLDPQFSEAYEGIARVYSLLVDLRYAPGKEQVYRELSEKNVLNAIKFDRNNGNAYAVLGNLYADQYRWEEAISAFEIALDLNPEDALINYWFSLRLRSTGDLERALKYHQIASDLDPLHPVIHAGYVYTCGLAGSFALAEEILQKVEPIMTNSFLFYMVKGNLLLRQGAFEGAIVLSKKALELNPTFKSPESDLFYCLGKLGKKQEVLQYIESLDKTQGLDCLRGAKAMMGIEETESALNYLQQAADLGVMDEDLLVEPIFASLRQHPIYLEILEQYNLKPFSTAIEFNFN